MKLYVPEIGDKMKLTEDWTFDLHWEHRNTGLLKHFFNEEFTWGRRDVAPRPVTLKAGTVLTVDRIYIRQGASDYSSISFYANVSESGKGAFGKPKNPRFWATLKDCNKIHFDIENVEPPIKLTFGNFYNVENGQRYWGNHGKPVNDLTYVQEDYCYKSLGAKQRVQVLKVKVSCDLEKMTETINSFSFIGRSTHEYYVMKNPKYTLLTLEGAEIGSWKTLASLKKNAKDYIKKEGL